MKHIALILTFSFFLHSSINGQILNNSFENNSSPDLSNWEWRCSAYSDTNIPPDGGNWSIRVTGGNLQGCFPNYAYQKIPGISNGEIFSLSGWAAGETAQLFFGKINNNIITFQTGSVFASGSWTNLNVQSTISLDFGDTAIVILSVGTTGGGHSLNGYFDLISIEQLNGINNNQYVRNITISPNPFNNQTTLSADQTFQNATLIITNSLGQKVKQLENLNGQTIILNRDNLLTGLYVIHLSERNKIFASKKMIIID